VLIDMQLSTDGSDRIHLQASCQHFFFIHSDIYMAEYGTLPVCYSGDTEWNVIYVCSWW
jgi:hypothetical protein